MALYQTIFSPASGLCLNGRIVRPSTFPTDAGGYADVYVGNFESQKVAIKVLRPFRLKRDKLLRRLWREYLAWSHLSHVNVLPCLGYSYDFSSETHALPSLISPWMANGTVTSYLEDNPDADRLNLLVGVANGLSYLHTLDPVIVHGDIRGGNILVSDKGVPCLTDFGLSRVLEEIKGLTTSSDLAGTVRWMSPELFENDGEISVHSDSWAFGMTILEVMSGSRPYSTIRNDLIVLSQIREGRLPSRPLDCVRLDNDVWELCRRCWSLEPTQRPAIGILGRLIGRRRTGEAANNSITEAVAKMTEPEEVKAQGLLLRKLFEDVVGCEEIIRKLEGYQRMVQNKKGMGKDALDHIPTNFLFTGPSGTGKTMVARKMGQVYCNLGVLDSTEVIECSLSGLVGQYEGQMEPEVKKLFQTALGRVLLIDGHRFHQKKYSKGTRDELVDTLQAVQKTFFREKLVVILAGHEEDINEFMSLDSGLAGLLQEKVIFHHIPPVQCLKILDRKLGKEKISVEAFQDPSSEAYVRMMALIQELSRLSSWENGRDLAILFKQIVAVACTTQPTLNDTKGPLALSGMKAVECMESMLSKRREHDVQSLPNPGHYVKKSRLGHQAPPPSTCQRKGLPSHGGLRAQKLGDTGRMSKTLPDMRNIWGF